MNHLRIVCLAVLLLNLLATGVFAEEPSTMWYKTPAANRNEAFPIGNGRMGAMVFGVPQQDRILLYERTGSQRSIDLRRGELNLAFLNHKTFKNYKRALDLNAAIATMDYTASDGVAYHREYMASFSDSVLIVRLTTGKKENLSCNLTLKSSVKRFKVIDGQAMLILAGTTDQTDASGNKYRFVTVVKPWVTGGRCGLEKGNYSIRKADEAIIYVASLSVPATDKRTDLELADHCAKTVARAYGKDYMSMKKKHETRYQQLFNQVRLDFGRTAQADKPTDQRIKEQAKSSDPSLMTLYVDYCRYLWISNTINATHVVPLQSLWAEQTPPVIEPKPRDDWYSAVETWGVSSLREPLFKMARSKDDATALAASSRQAIPGGGATYVRYLWDHYLFTGDKAFLSEHFPFMQTTARFCLDSLKTTSEETKLAINTVFSHVMEATDVLHTGIKGRLSPERAFADSLKKRYQPLFVSNFDDLSQQWLNKLNVGFIQESSSSFEEQLSLPSRLADCLLQSREGYIFVLPSLPKSWTDGSVSGLKARGGFEVSFSWKKGKLTTLSIRSILGGVCRIRCEEALQGAGLKSAKGTVINPLLGAVNDETVNITEGSILVDLPTEAGKTYNLTVL